MLRDALGQAPADRAKQRYVDPVPLGRLLDQARVLGRQRQPEQRLELALEHRLALHPQVGASNNRLGSTPSPSASAIVSAPPSTTVSTQLLATIFRRVPA